MTCRPRIYCAQSQKAQMWDCQQQGDSMQAMAGLSDRGHSSIQRTLLDMAGIHPL